MKEYNIELNEEQSIKAADGVLVNEADLPNGADLPASVTN